MKKILVVLRHNEKEFKCDKKYNGIINALSSQGLDVFYTNTSDDKILLINNGETKVIGEMKSGALKKLSRNTAIYKAIFELFNSGFACDFVYIRSIPQCPAFIKMVKKMKKTGSKIVIEIPTHPIKLEQKSDKRVARKFIYAYMNFFEKLSAKYIDLYALMGKHDDSYLNRPAVNIQNGIDINAFPLRNYKPDMQQINLIGVAKVARWHGFDRVIDGINLYKQNGGQEKIVFHIVGPEGDGSLAEYMSKVTALGLENEVVFEGPKYGDELSALFDTADLAIGSLGIYRINMTDVSVLKLREYMARGIPFIYSTNDEFINHDWRFCKKIPGNDTPVNIAELIDFICGVRKVDNLSSLIRNTCRINMTWETQMKIIFDKLDFIK